MIEIIPAIDLIDGKCVRLTQGDFSRKTVYDADPVETAKRFESAGIKRLHIVDLDGARTGRPANTRVLEQVAASVDLVIDFGGGLTTETDVKQAFDAGAEMVSIGSIAVKDAERFFGWLDHFGTDAVLLGADVRDGKLSVRGWQEATEIDIVPFLVDYSCRGVDQAFVTDIGRDGAMSGPSLRLYTEVALAVPDLRLIASGGVSSLDDIDQLALARCSGVIIGKAIYEGAIKLEDLTRYVG